MQHEYKKNIYCMQFLKKNSLKILKTKEKTPNIVKNNITCEIQASSKLIFIFKNRLSSSVYNK